MNKKTKMILGILVIFSICWIGYIINVPNSTKDERISEKRNSVKGTWVVASISNRGEEIKEEDLLGMYGGTFIYDFTTSKEVLMGVAPSLETCEYSQKGAMVTITYDGELLSTFTMLDDDTMESDGPDAKIKLVRE